MESKKVNGENEEEKVATLPTPSVAVYSPKKTWVKFDDEDENKDNNDTAVIDIENSQIKPENALNNVPPVATQHQQLNNSSLRTVQLPLETVQSVRQGFRNGDVIVTLLPTNSHLAWITPAKFRPELVPEELMAQGLTITVDEYVQVMELLVNDIRFVLYNVCYKRVLFFWLSVSFIVLLALLFSGLSGLPLFALGVAWLIMNAAAIFVAMWLKSRLNRNLEKCLANVNKQLLRHKILIALDDRGKISCHKVSLCFIYLDSAECVQKLQGSIESHERESSGWEQRMDLTVNDIFIQGSSTTRLSRKQERATLLFLRYASRWGKEAVRGYLKCPPAQGNYHCAALTCPCQYVIKHLDCKPGTKLTLKSFFTLPNQDADVTSSTSRIP